MQNAMMSLLLAISNGLGLKSVGYCFQLLEFHTYNNNKIVFITMLYIPHSSIIHIVLYFPPCNFMEKIYSTLFLLDPPMQTILFNSYTMGTSGLPHIYTQSPRAAGPRATGLYIRRTTSAHGITECTWYNYYVTLSFYANGFTIFIVVLIAFYCGFRL